MSSVEFIDNSQAVLSETELKIERALFTIGQEAEEYAKEYLETDPKRVDTGRLRNSITNTYVMKGELGGEVTIGTNVEYAVYVHEGTGLHATGGSGAKNIPWFFQDAKGQWHKTYGMEPNRFLKKAIQNHVSAYEKIAKSFLEG